MNGRTQGIVDVVDGAASPIDGIGTEVSG